MSHKPTVVTTHPVHAEVRRLLSSACAVVENTTGRIWTAADLAEQARGAVALIVFMTDRVDADLLASLPSLQIIAAALKGADNIDLEACRRHGITVTKAESLLTAPTAELAMALMIGVSRRLAVGDDAVRRDFSGWRPILFGSGLAGRTLGVVGFGAIGEAIARRAQAFDMQVACADPDPQTRNRAEPLGVRVLPLARLVGTSDFVVLAAPLTPETLRFFDHRRISAMKPGAYLINVARGSLVDEAAVALALEAGQLAGYAADVFAVEDLAVPDRPRAVEERLRSNRLQTLFTPHLGSAVADVRLQIELECARSILSHLGGAGRAV